jgi:hypothetical protein
MEDWRYENLSDRIDRLQDEVREVRGRTNKVESWQSLMPFRFWMGVWWLMIAGIWIAVIVDVTGALDK